MSFKVLRLVVQNLFTSQLVLPGLDVLQEKHIVLLLPALHQPHRDGLIAEMSAYAQLCAEENYTGLHFKEKAAAVDNFWHTNGAEFQTWQKLANHLSLLQPSSGASERVFSILLAVLKRPGMDGALIDYIESVFNFEIFAMTCFVLSRFM